MRASCEHGLHASTPTPEICGRGGTRATCDMHRLCDVSRSRAPLEHQQTSQTRGILDQHQVLHPRAVHRNWHRTAVAADRLIGAPPRSWWVRRGTQSRTARGRGFTTQIPHHSYSSSLVWATPHERSSCGTPFDPNPPTRVDRSTRTCVGDELRSVFGLGGVMVVRRCRGAWLCGRL